MKTERRSFELRATAEGVLEGVVIPYNQETSMGRIREMFIPGSVRFPPQGVGLNKGHVRALALARTNGGGLELTDTPTALRAKITLPDTQDARDVLTLIRNRVMTGLSAEFHAVRQIWRGNLRVVEEAIVGGLAIVDAPQYAGATLDEIRANCEYEGPPVMASDLAGIRRDLPLWVMS